MFFKSSMRVLGSLRLEGCLRGFARVVAGFYRLVEGNTVVQRLDKGSPF